MKRSDSMERAVPIILDLPDSSSRFSPAEDEEEDQPPPLPRTPEPGTSSGSTPSWLSPDISAKISYDFGFLDESPGIPLVSSSSDLEHSFPEGEWSEQRMAKVDVRSDALSSVGNGNSPFFTNTGSLESLEGGPSSSTCDDITTGTSGSCMPLSHASQPSLYYHYMDSENQLSEANRSKSVDDITNTPKMYVPDPYYSLDRMRRGSNASNNNNNLEKLSYAVLAEDSFMQSEREDALPNDEGKYFSDDVYDLLNCSDFSIPDSPSAAWQEDRQSDLEKSRGLELPSISEENEEHNRSRRSSMNVGQRSSLDFGLPEPAEIAPGSFNASASNDWVDGSVQLGDNHQVIHRRVVSDNYVSYGGKSSTEELFSPRSEVSEPITTQILLRDAPGRASQTGRCQSQVVLHHSESSPSAVDRSLSNSDPELNKELAPRGPPPVFLPRRNSSLKNNSGSWQTFFNHGNATPHHVVTPATASLSSASSSRSGTRTNVVGDCTNNGQESPGPSPNAGLTRSSSSSSVVAFVRRSIRRLSGGSRRDSLTPSPEALTLIQENGTLRRRATTPYRKQSRLKMMRDKSRIEKKREKSGSDTFSTISNFFGKGRKKDRASIDTLVNGYTRSNHPGASTMPAKKSVERPGFPLFSEDIVIETLHNVNRPDERFLTVGIVEEPTTEIKRSVSNELGECHRREHSDGEVRRRSQPDYLDSPSHRRSSSLFLEPFPKLYKRRGSKLIGGLPDNISAVFSPTGSPEDDDHGQEKADVMTILNDNPKYFRLGLFNPPTCQSWHEKFNHEKFSAKAVKKQDAIYELINLERQHCANLAFLQEGYRRQMIERNLLSRDELDILIPDVIDSLLVFHCHLLEKLMARQNESIEVETISDILLKELSEEGTYTAVCTDAYTQFGSLKEKSEERLNVHMVRNLRFSEFMKRCARDKSYKQYDFKSIMARIISRPTKYGLLIETILRNEANKFSEAAELTEKALLASKRFALRIDNNLLVVQVTKRWDIVRAHFDNSSQISIYVTDKALPCGYVKLNWTLEDVCAHKDEENGRRLLCIGEANVKSGPGSRANNVMLVCFDDILVFLCKKNNGKYSFAPLEQPVLCIGNLILRSLAGHGLTMMLMSGVKPTLLEIEFHNKQTFAKWKKILEMAIPTAPARVRLRPHTADECLRQATIAHEVAEKKQKEAEEVWMKKLITLFEQKSEQESTMVNDYISKRMHFVDEIQLLLSEMPLRGRPDLLDRVRDTVRLKFREMRNMKTVPTNKLVEDMTHAKEAILWSYIDELEGGTRGEGDSDGSGSDSSGSNRSRPRRIKTFHGTGQSTSKQQKSSLRRHTTVPRMKEETDLGEESDDAKREREHVDEKAHDLPLTQSLSCHRECRRLLRDLEKLKSENVSLKNELALDKIRITSLERMRSSSTTVLSTSVETLEALRRKERDVREDEQRRKDRLEEFEKELQDKSNKLEEERILWEQKRQKEKLEHQRREAELEEKWAVLKEAERTGDCSPSRISSRQRISMNDYVVKSPTIASVQMMTPELKNLTVKTEYRKKK